MHALSSVLHALPEVVLFVARLQVVTVADGVGSWGNLNIDPGLYSKDLTKNIGTLFMEKMKKYI